MTLGVGGVHQGDDAVQHVALAEFLVGEEGLRHRRRIGQAGALDHQAVEVDFAVVAALQQEEQGLFQVGVDRAADAAVGQRHHLHRLDAEQLAVDRRLTVLVLDHRDLHAVLGLQQVLEQGGLAGAEEAGEHGDGDRGVVVVGYFGHAQLPEDAGHVRRGPRKDGDSAAADRPTLAATVARLLALAEELLVGHHRLVRVLVRMCST